MTSLYANPLPVADIGVQTNPLATHEAPTQRRYRQLPVTVPALKYDVPTVFSAINAHENGLFNQSAILHDAMMRDDRYAGCMQTRVQTAAGAPRTVKLAERSDAEEARVALDGAASRMIPKGARAQLREWCVGLGFAIAQVIKVYDSDTESWRWSLEPWHPQYIYYRLDIESYQLITYEGIVDVGHGIPGQFVVYEPYGRRSWMSGTLRSLGMNWLGRNFAMNRDWPRLMELYALGIRKAIVPPDADQRKKGPFLRQVNALGAETTIVVEQDTEPGGPKYDLEIVTPPVANNAQAYDTYIERTDNNYAIRILGVNLTTKASAKSSSGAAAQAQSDIQGEIVAADLAADAETENAQFFGPWLAEHYGPEAAASVTIDYGASTDRSEADRISAITAIAPSLAALQAAGADVGELLRELDVPMLAEPPPPAAPPNADGTPSPTEPVHMALSTGDVRAPSMRHAIAAQQLLDQWHSAGMEPATDVVNAFVERLVAVCESGPTFDSVRQSVLALYAQRDVSRSLTDAMQTARLRARLLGGLAVVREGASNGPVGGARLRRAARRR